MMTVRIALAAIVASSVWWSEAAPDQILDRLALYDEGKFEEAVRGIATITDQLTAYEQLVAAGGGWILTAPVEAQPRRRLVAASLALEVAAVGPAPTPEERGRGLTFASGPVPLVAWGAVALVQQEPAAPGLTRPRLTVPRHPGELPWFQAAAALLQRGSAYRALIRLSDDMPLYSPLTVFPLLETALARFPGDPELRLARAGANQRTAVSSNIGGRLRPIDAMRSTLGDRGPGFGAAERGYRELIADETVGVEARLRLGFIRFLKGDESEARDLFREVDRLAADPDVKYAARLLTAWSWEVERRHDAALTAFRQALEIAPDAYSAAVPVAAALLTAGRLAEAEALLVRALVPDHYEHDPLTRFDLADSRFFPRRLERLRAALAR